MAVMKFKSQFLADTKKVFLIIHKDGFISETTKNTFKVSKARQEAKKYKSWQAALKMARECGAEEIQEVWESNINIVVRRCAVDWGGDHDDVRY